MTSGRKAGVTMNLAPARMPTRAVSASSTVPRPKRKSGRSAMTFSSMRIAPGVVIVSSMLVNPPAARALAQSRRPSGESARMSAMTFSALNFARMASFFMARNTMRRRPREASRAFGGRGGRLVSLKPALDDAARSVGENDAFVFRVDFHDDHTALWIDGIADAHQPAVDQRARLGPGHDPLRVQRGREVFQFLAQLRIW